METQVVLKRIIKRRRVLVKTYEKYYFDGELCLGKNIARSACLFYNLSQAQLALGCGVEAKEVRKWMKHGVEPSQKSKTKIFKVIELAKDFKKRLKELGESQKSQKI